MQKDSIKILCTRPLSDDLIDRAKDVNIDMDIIPFINSQAIDNEITLDKIREKLLVEAIVVFTSMNAVEAVAREFSFTLPSWRIYCLGYRTMEIVKSLFGENSICGIADDATGLARKLVADKVSGEVIFFCGNRRRDELPDILRENNIEVEEVVVYHTINLPVKLEKIYDGILFFSPSAVESFFENNSLDPTTILFATGITTSNEIRKFTSNTIHISTEPGKENLVKEVIEFYNK